MATGKTQLCCLIGDPVSHSLSPRMFSAAFEKVGLDWAYLAFKIKSGDLPAALKGLKVLGVVGFNVTMPHKIDVLKHLDGVKGVAHLIGSVNVVANCDGELLGYNTDGAGVLAALDHEGIEVNGRRVLLVGYGGAGRAVAFEIVSKKKPFELIIAGRDKEKADGLAKELGERIAVRGVSLGSIAATSQGADVIINATPVGMRNMAQGSPIPEELLQPRVAVLDLVYVPLETRLLNIARERGSKVIEGLEVLVQQGAMSFEIWTGHPAPVEEMRKAAREGIR